MHLILKVSSCLIWILKLKGMAALIFLSSPFEKGHFIKKTPKSPVFLQGTVTSGLIPLRTEGYKSVCKNKKHGFIFKSFRSLENANKLLNESRETQCKALTKISVCYPKLFYVNRNACYSALQKNWTFWSFAL